MVIENLNRPLQPDGTSCGLLVASMVYSRLISKSAFEQLKSTRDHVDVMRLRLLWILLCESKTNTPYTLDDEDKARVQEVNSEILRLC